MKNKEKSFLSAVVYVYNDVDVLRYFLSKLMETLENNFEKFEIICVDDASSDNSADCVKEFKNMTDKGIISIVSMSYHQGLELSMNAGLDMAIGDFVFEFDTAYMDYPIELIMDVFHRSLEGYDICSAGNKKQKFTSSLFYWVFNKNAKIEKHIVSETFRVLSRRSINRIQSMSVSTPYRKALYANSGLKTDIIFYKASSKIKINKRKKVLNSERRETAFSSIILFTDIAYRISLIISTIMMLLTVSGVIYTIVIFILKKPIAGYTTMMLILTSAFFAVFGILAIIIKYLSVLIDLVFKKKRYTISSVEKL
jgi:dolichol-phosphate mannosyltransferase